MVVASAYVWALAARTGGRPVVFGGAHPRGRRGACCVADQEVLRNGAAVMTCAVSAILAVVATVPAVKTRVAVREVAVAVVVAALGGARDRGAASRRSTSPASSTSRWRMALVGGLVVVYRLGAGLHGLGRRGLFIVVFGGVVLALTLAYGELLRRYGTPALVQNTDEGILWLREHAGASPRPIVAVLGVPALMWGVHMRARRRQGWWVCVFGVAATAPIAQALLQPVVPLQECGARPRLRRGRGAAARLRRDPRRRRADRRPEQPRPARPPRRGGGRAPARAAAHRRAAVSRPARRPRFRGTRR